MQDLATMLAMLPVAVLVVATALGTTLILAGLARSSPRAAVVAAPTRSRIASAPVIRTPGTQATPVAELPPPSRLVTPWPVAAKRERAPTDLSGDWDFLDEAETIVVAIPEARRAG